MAEVKRPSAHARRASDVSAGSINEQTKSGQRPGCGARSVSYLASRSASRTAVANWRHCVPAFGCHVGLLEAFINKVAFDTSPKSQT